MPARCFSPLEALKVIGKRYRSIELGMLTEPHLGSERRSTHRPRRTPMFWWLVFYVVSTFIAERGAGILGYIARARGKSRKIAKYREVSP